MQFSFKDLCDALDLFEIIHFIWSGCINDTVGVIDFRFARGNIISKCACRFLSCRGINSGKVTAFHCASLRNPAITLDSVFEAIETLGKLSDVVVRPVCDLLVAKNTVFIEFIAQFGTHAFERLKVIDMSGNGSFIVNHTQISIVADVLAAETAGDNTVVIN